MPIEKVKSMFNFVEKEDQNSLLQENATFVKFTMSVDL